MGVGRYVWSIRSSFVSLSAICKDIVREEDAAEEGRKGSWEGEGEGRREGRG